MNNNELEKLDEEIDLSEFKKSAYRRKYEQETGKEFKTEVVMPDLPNEPRYWGNNYGIIYFLIDCSHSMRERNKLEQARNGAIDFREKALKHGSYFFGIISFSDDAYFVLEPKFEKSEIAMSLNYLIADGNTNIASALDLGIQKFLSQKINERILVLVTDGMPNKPDNNPEYEAILSAQRAKNSGIEIFTIGTDDADFDFLKKLATRTEFAVKVQHHELRKAIEGSAEKLKLLKG